MISFNNFLKNMYNKMTKVKSEEEKEKWYENNVKYYDSSLENKKPVVKSSTPLICNKNDEKSENDGNENDGNVENIENVDDGNVDDKDNILTEITSDELEIKKAETQIAAIETQISSLLNISPEVYEKILEGEYHEDDIWIPCDQIISKYESKTFDVSMTSSFVHQKKEIETRIQSIRDTCNHIERTFNPESDTFISDYQQLTELKNDLLSEEMKIKKINIKLEGIAKEKEELTKIIFLYGQYMKEANLFIEKNNLTDIVTVNDIITNNNFCIFFKKLLDAKLFSNEKGSMDAGRKILILSKHFDIKDSRDKLKIQQIENIKRRQAINGLNISYLQDSINERITDEKTKHDAINNSEGMNTNNTLTDLNGNMLLTGLVSNELSKTIGKLGN